MHDITVRPSEAHEMEVPETRQLRDEHTAQQDVRALRFKHQHRPGLATDDTVGSRHMMVAAARSMHAETARGIARRSQANKTHASCPGRLSHVSSFMLRFVRCTHSAARAAGRSFGTLGLSPRVVARLCELGLEAPTAVQSLSLPHLIKRESAIVTAPTGSGKSLGGVIRARIEL